MTPIRSGQPFTATSEQLATLQRLIKHGQQPAYRTAPHIAQPLLDQGIIERGWANNPIRSSARTRIEHYIITEKGVTFLSSLEAKPS